MAVRPQVRLCIFNRRWLALLDRRQHVMKTCLDCKQKQPATSFYKNKATWDKLTVYCKTCQKARMGRGSVREQELKQIIAILVDTLQRSCI